MAARTLLGFDHDLEQSTLPSNASRWDWMHARADPDFLKSVWSTWTLVSELAAVASFIVIFGVMRCKVARRDIFNQYIVFLCLPDLIFSFFCGIQCALNWSHGAYYGGGLACELQSFYVAFGFACSMLMQAVIAGEIHRALECLHKMRTYTQPTLRSVLRKVGGIYALSLFLATWTSIDALPIHAGAASGIACVPLAHDASSELFFWLVYLGVGFFMPFCRILWLAIDTLANSYHKPVQAHFYVRGMSAHKTKELLNFFFKVLCLYMLMWLPTVVSIWVFDPRVTGNKIGFFGGAWSHTQGLLSALLYLCKPDVLFSVRQLPLIGRAVGALVECWPRSTLRSCRRNLSRSLGPRRVAPSTTWPPLSMVPWSLLHVGSCLGRAVLVDGHWVFTGEGYDPAADVPDAAIEEPTSDSLVRPPESVACRSEDFAYFPPQFPLKSTGQLAKLLDPRFAELSFEQRYQSYLARGMDGVQLYFAGGVTCFIVAAWVYALATGNLAEGLDLRDRHEALVAHATLFVAWGFWAVLRSVPCASRRGSEIQGLQISLLVTLFCWTLPATAIDSCSDAKANRTVNAPFEVTLAMTLSFLLSYVAVVCRVYTKIFVMLAMVTLLNLCVHSPHPHPPTPPVHHRVHHPHCTLRSLAAQCYFSFGLAPPEPGRGIRRGWQTNHLPFADPVHRLHRSAAHRPTDAP